ncbi:hypothetical protein R9X47_23090 [Wukongibacter baidiensis]|uniref:hypothetical protein n=1 Tax=Wukongibacter baidiensis TaxID=1723361 RepID=UPI003D7FA403
MKAIRLLLPLVISILIITPINPVKSFNHKSDKNLVINYKTNSDFSHKISYFI